MRVKGICAAVLAAICAALPISAGAEGIEFALNGVRFNNALLGGLPVPAGVDVEFRIPVAADTLLFTVRAAGGYEDRLILRDAAGDPIAKPAPFDAADQTNWFHWPNAQADLGILYRPLGSEKPKVELFAMARGRWEANSPDLSTSVFSDAQGMLAVSVMGGAGVDAVVTDPRRSKSGYGGEISFEYGPSALALSGGNDFYRLSANLEGYLPLFSAGSSDLSAVSAYAAGYLAGDWAGGSAIPLYVLTSFGGRLLRDGLGDSIRGYQGWGYEATAKAEASVDLRLAGPALFGVAGLRPMAYLFGDAGYFGGLDRCASISDKDGFIVSAGAGVALDILDFVYLGARAGYKFPVDDPLYSTYTAGGDKFFWNITFLLHF